MKTKLFSVLVLLCLLGAALSGISNASTVVLSVQDSTVAPLTPEQRVDLRLSHAKHVLHLSDLQMSQMRTVLLAHEGSLQTDRTNLESTTLGTPEREAARKKLIAEIQAMNLELKPILNTHQLAKWRKILMRELRRREIELRRRQEELHR